MLAVIRKLFSRNKLQANIQLVPWRVGSWKKEAAGHGFVYGWFSVFSCVCLGWGAVLFSEIPLVFSV